MSPYEVKVGSNVIGKRSEQEARRCALVERVLQATRQHPVSVRLYHYGELVAEW